MLGFRFTGKEEDLETKLIYFGARYYDARVSSWLSTDPALGEYLPTGKQLFFPEQEFKPGSLKGMGGVYNAHNLQLYLYVGANPIKMVDPSGRHEWQAVWLTASDIAARQLTGADIHLPTIDKAGRITGQLSLVAPVSSGTSSDSSVIMSGADNQQVRVGLVTQEGISDRINPARALQITASGQDNSSGAFQGSNGLEMYNVQGGTQPQQRVVLSRSGFLTGGTFARRSMGERPAMADATKTRFLAIVLNDTENTHNTPKAGQTSDAHTNPTFADLIGKKLSEIPFQE